jgi:hypothetical protein
MGEPGLARQRQAGVEVVDPDPSGDFNELGFVRFPSAIDIQALSSLTHIATGIPGDAGGRRWAGPALEALVVNPTAFPVRDIIKKLAPDATVLRIVAFKKDEGANWFVPAHQDRSVPIPSAELPPGFSRPTRKDDGWQAEAPIEVLQTMRTIRIFVDPATADDGPLEVAPGTHRLGRIEQSGIRAIVERSKWQQLTGGAGDVVMLSPLLLHRSQRAIEPRGRRVLQVECIPPEIAARHHLPAVRSQNL